VNSSSHSTLNSWKRINKLNFYIGKGFDKLNLKVGETSHLPLPTGIRKGLNELYPNIRKGLNYLHFNIREGLDNLHFAIERLALEGAIGLINFFGMDRKR